VMLAAGLRFASVIQQQPETEATTYPQTAVDWIAANHPDGNLYNTYGWGGYLIWRLYPEYPVYIDGRADVYGDEFIYDYLRIYSGQPSWEEKLEATGVRLVLIEPESGLANALRQDGDWEIIHEDTLSILFEAK
jgi:hypothetical protein